jgi:hypothetical protein
MLTRTRKHRCRGQRHAAEAVGTVGTYAITCSGAAQAQMTAPYVASATVTVNGGAVLNVTGPDLNNPNAGRLV